MSRLALTKTRTISTRGDLPLDDQEFLPPGAALLTTPGLRRAQAAAVQTLQAKRIVALEGVPGSGKSTTLAAIAASIDAPSHRLLVMPGTTPKQFFIQLHSELAGHEVSGRLTQREHENAVRRLLRQQPRLILVDEAQFLPVDVLRILRFLLQEPQHKFALVLAGTGITRLLAKDQMLDTWVGLRIQHDAFTSNDIELIRQLHPCLAGASAELLAEINKRHCHGLLRNWCVLVEWLNGNVSGPLTNQAARAAIAGIRGSVLQLRAA